MGSNIQNVSKNQHTSQKYSPSPPSHLLKSSECTKSTSGFWENQEVNFRPSEQSPDVTRAQFWSGGTDRDLPRAASGPWAEVQKPLG